MLVTACIKDDANVADAGEEVTVKLSASTRAAGDDPLVRDNDDHVGSLAVYAFDANGNFLRLFTFTPDFVNNTYTTDAFSCGIGVKTLFAIANYADYPDLELKPLNYNAVKALVANAANTTNGLTATNILMVGEATGLAFQRPADQDENIDVDINLKRLAARVDVFVLKEAEWAADVKVTKVEFSGGVKNTTLTYQEGEVNLPSSLDYDTPLTSSGNDTSLEAFEGENEQVWTQDKHLRGSFYTYRTVQEQASEHVPQLAVTIKVNDNIEKTYTAIVADKNTGSDTPVILDAGNVYQVCAIMTKTGLVIEMQVADWEEAPRYDLEFSYPTYRNPLTPWDDVTAQPPYDQPTVYFNPDENSTDGTARFSFSLTAPAGQAWRATLLDATEADFEVKVYQGGNEIANPAASADPFEIRVRALRNDNVDKTVKLGIAFTPAWDPLSSSLLMINGTPSAPAWARNEGDTSDPTVIVIKQIERPL